jgi:hypothetical protein
MGESGYPAALPSGAAPGASHSSGEGLPSLALGGLHSECLCCWVVGRVRPGAPVVGRTAPRQLTKEIRAPLQVHR